MLTLQEVKQLIEMPGKSTCVPSARYLKDCGNVLLCRRIGKGSKLTVYREGYAVYEIGKNATVFPIAACGDYVYGEPGESACIREEVFDGLAWHIRLFLEGEDRLCRNRESYEREKKISYSAVSEEWMVLEDLEEPVLERLIREETIKDLLNLLTERQRIIICQFYFQKKTQKEISEEFDITPAAVRRIRAQAIRRIQKKRGIPMNNRRDGKGAASHAGQKTEGQR